MKNNRFEGEILKSHIDIELSKPLNSRERELLSSLDYEGEVYRYTTNEFLKRVRLKEAEEGERFLKLLAGKDIVISSERDGLSYRTSIIQSFSISRKEVSIYISRELVEGCRIREVIGEIDLKKLLRFRIKQTYRLYIYLMKNLRDEVVIPLEELREIMDIRKTYNRYYDIEKNIILPVIEEIEAAEGIFLSYQKLRRGPHRNSKVDGIMISLGGEEVCEEEERSISGMKRSLREHVVEKIISNPFILHSEVLKLLKLTQRDDHYNSTLIIDSKFLVKIYTIKDGEDLHYEDEYFKLHIHYRRRERSTLKLILREEEIPQL